MIRVTRRRTTSRPATFAPLALLVAGLLGLSLTAPAASAAPTAEAPAAPTAEAPAAQAGKVPGKTSTLTITTYNVSFEVRVKKTVRDLKQIAQAKPDVIALQEMSSWKRREAVRKAMVDCDGCEYAKFMPVPAVQGGTPMLYRKDKFELLGSDGVKLTEDTYVGPKGAGPSTINAKWANWIQLRDLETRRKFTVINNHFVPTVQTGDGGPNDNKKRVELYRKHMNGLTGLISDLRQRNGGLVFLTGDFNVSYRGDKVVKAEMFPYHALGQEMGIRSSFQNISEPKEGTHVLPNGHSLRLIDYVMNLDRRSVEPKSHQIIFGLNSDHRALQVDYTLKGRGCFTGNGGC